MSKTRLGAALAAGAATAALAAGCGSDGEPRGLIPAARADALSRDVAQVRDLADAGKCEQARAAADRLNAEVSALGSGVDPRLREALTDGVGRLALLIDEPGACEEPVRTTTVQTTTQPPPPAPVATTEEKPKKEKKDEEEDNEEETQVPGEEEQIEEPPAGTEGGGVIPGEQRGDPDPPGQGGGVAPSE